MTKENKLKKKPEYQKLKKYLTKVVQISKSTENKIKKVLKKSNSLPIYVFCKNIVYSADIKISYSSFEK